MTITGPWEITIDGTAIRIDPPEIVTVVDEKYESLDSFNAGAAPWARGTKLLGVIAQECTKAGALIPGSVKIRPTTDDDAAPFAQGTDYEIDEVWANLGRTAKSAIGEKTPVVIDYQYVQMRLDSIVRASDGKIVLKKGQPQVANPKPPQLETSETRLANVWITGRGMDKLTDANLFLITETTYPESPKPTPSIAEKLLPATMKKLTSGQPVKILAWGDSVTDGSYLPNPSERWQEQFVKQLRERFPAAKIELVTEAWGGRNTDAYLGVPPGQPHNYKETVLGQKPDLIISEFVNDSGRDENSVNQFYSQFQKDFKAIGAEWIILTPHYVWTDWMPANAGKPFGHKECDQDPRPYVAALRKFTAANNIPLADASLRWGRLWRQGIPYSTLLLNSLNHPDGHGMSLFSDSLLELFP